MASPQRVKKKKNYRKWKVCLETLLNLIRGFQDDREWGVQMIPIENTDKGKSDFEDHMEAEIC